MMSKEEEFALAIANFENRPTNNIEEYFNDEFNFDIKAQSIGTKIYHKIQELWSQGLLEVFIKNNILSDKLEVKDLVAFDSARFVKFLLEILKLKLMDEKEIWGLLFLNAARVQDTFNNAQEFKASYFKGALYYEILFQSDEEDRGEKIQNFDTLVNASLQASDMEILWLEEDIFKTLKIEKATSATKPLSVNEDETTLMHTLLKQEDKRELWQLLDSWTQEERDIELPQLYSKHITAEDYLELPALYPTVSYAHYLRAVYFYNYAWEARGLGITNTVGQKNYALFYERLRYARADLKKAYELSPNEQTYWAELYNLVKHFRNKDSDTLEEELYERIKENAMHNVFCIERVSHMKKARWGGSHKESLDWAREVVSSSKKGDGLKIIIFEVLIEQYNYILEYDKDEEKANAIFQEEALQDEVNEYFDELLGSSYKVKSKLLFWYEKVGDLKRVKMLTNLL